MKRSSLISFVVCTIIIMKVSYTQNKLCDGGKRYLQLSKLLNKSGSYMESNEFMFDCLYLGEYIDTTQIEGTGIYHVKSSSLHEEFRILFEYPNGKCVIKEYKMIDDIFEELSKFFEKTDYSMDKKLLYTKRILISIETGSGRGTEIVENKDTLFINSYSLEKALIESKVLLVK